MKIVECPVCGRKYRFDDAKMSKESIKVRCRKCENIFVISKNTFSPTEPEPAPSPAPLDEPSSEAPQEARPMSLVIKSVPNETARLRIAARLMPLTRRKLSDLNRRLSKTPVIFPCEMTPEEADNLLRAVELSGAEAEFSQGAASRRRKGLAGEAVPRSRRKWWILGCVLIVLLMIGGGFSYHIYRETGRTHVLEKRGIDSVIPAGAFLYLRLRDTEKNWLRIQDSAVKEGLGPLLESLKSIPQVQRLLPREREWEIGTGLPFLRFNPMDLIGSDVRIAMYTGDVSGNPQFLLTLKANPKIKLMETVGKWIARWQNGTLLKTVDQVPGVFAVHLEGLQREFYFYSEGMVYVISTSQDLIQTSLFLANGRLPAKKSLKSVSLLAQKGEKGGLNQIGLFYVGFENLTGASLGQIRGDQGVSFLKSLQGCGEVVGTISYGKGLVVESVMTVDRDRLSQPFRTFLECPPGPNRTLAYVPTDTIVYVSNNGLDLSAHLSWLRDGLKTPRGSPIDVDSILQGIKASTGVNIEEEILPFLGTGFSYAIIGGGDQGHVPLPGVQFFFEVKDRSKLEVSLQRLLTKPVIRSWFKGADVDLVSRTHEGVPITHLRYNGDDMGLFFLSAFTPCYAFVDGFLVIGTGLENLEHMVNLSRGKGASMLKDRRFRRMKRFLGDKSSGMAYVNVRAISQLVRDFVPHSPLASFAESRVNGAQDLQALLRVLETLDYVWSETEFQGDRVRILIYLAL